MARRRLLTREVLARQLDPPTDEREIARHFTLTREDLDWVSIRRGPASQLGYAMTLLYMRWPGRVLGADETPPLSILSFVARQLDVPEAAWHDYGRREPTRRAHLTDLARRMGYRAFGRTDFHALATFAMPVAQTIIQPLQLAEIVIDEMRRRRLLLPPVTVIEAIVRRARRQADELVHDVLTQGLGDGGRTRLDALLARRGDRGATWLSWLRNPPLSPAPRNVMRLLERLDHVRAIGLAPARAATIPTAAFDRIADEAVRITSQHLAELPDRRRHAVLAAAALRLRESLADAVLAMTDKLLGSMMRRAENRTRDKALGTIRALQAQLRLLTGSCRLLIDARAQGLDSLAAMAIDWEKLGTAVGEAEILVAPETTDRTAELIDRHRSLRPVIGPLLNAFTFQGAGPVQGLLDAVRIVGEVYRTGRRRLPDNPPLRFVPPSWRPFVLRDGQVVRAAYELCALTQLRDRLRAGDIWVEESRQYRAFDSYLLPPATFAALRERGPLPLAIDTDFDTFIAGRRARLDTAIEQVTALARQGELPQVRLDAGGLVISPLKAVTPPSTEDVRRMVYDRLPRVKITDLLLEVDGWTGFSECFTHRRSGRPADDRNALLTVILADGINLGLTRMADTCQAATLRQLAHLHDWHVSESAYGAAHGQLFHAGGRGAAIGDINARNGNEPGVSFYTHISDQYDPFASRVIAATAGKAPYVLDGLLYHATGLSIEEHYTDTGGASDHVFGLMPFFGYRFAPRLRDLKERRLHLLPQQDAGALLVGLTGDPVAVGHVADHWDELLRLVTSIRSGTVTASAMLRRLSAYPRQNGLALALREVGRIERSIFMLDWLRDIDLRRRAQAGLNKGEARNALARALFFNQLGELRDRRFENQTYRASGLNLLVAAIILWNTRYLEQAIAGMAVPPETARHIAPLGWEHISLTGDYRWNTDDRPPVGQLRPLRTPTSLLAA
ncbi:transposase family protein [Sphingomonas sp. S17]|jgi:TnpA family transposase|uniref:Tn3 family transposase n=2 Tax=Sphingomonas TaxID=13687 RepID=A0A7Y7QYH8_9SPHN|nr:MULTISPECIES: Tn3 family transposase [Sphingomonadaceae]EGI53438.1 transposase family protein [Sphingomonas sp. S17]MBQ1500019.1 Tn3 family transposase [Sphingomonas sp.]MBY0302080.1 Tn3 family transposase [Sphingomonas ginsenosidimutans]MBZ6383688.1 Tn3 family transposase [Sphingomonas sanguinis]MDK2759589.1 Tn3 family transposase [Blastomonas fulva]